MTNEQVDAIISRLKYACNYHRFNELGVVTEYAKAMRYLDYDRMEQAVDTLLEQDSTRVPSISQLFKVYKNESKMRSVTYENENYCSTCDNRGFIFLKEVRKAAEDGKGNTYEFIYYCPYCAAGTQYQYDGRNNTKNKSEYRIPSILEALPEEMLSGIREKNIENRKRNSQFKKMAAKERLDSAVFAIGKKISGV